MPTPIRPKKANGKEQNVYWIRKKVPQRYRDLVGKGEVWRSLKTIDRRTANERIAVVSAELDRQWARLAAEAKRGSKDSSGGTRLTHQDMHALRGNAHVQIRDAHIAQPGTGFAAMRWAALLGEPATTDDEEYLDRDAREFLTRQGETPTEAEVETFKPLFLKARQDAYLDVIRASKGDYSENPVLQTVPKRTTPKVDLVQVFEEYAAKGGLKAGVHGPTAKRWRPKIAMFVKWLGQRDLARMTTTDGYAWVDHLTAEGFATKSIRDVWIASLSATAGFAVRRRKPGVSTNVFRGIVVDERPEDEDATLPRRKKGFTLPQAETILTATLDGRSHLISEEMQAARRWLPWLCAYSGARVNELTSLYPADVKPDEETDIWCMIIKPSLEKTAQWRTVPIHSHVIEQGFLDYVEKRRRKGMPLFYDPSRSRGGKPGNPQFKKVGERIAEWVRGHGIESVAPNHGWRHRFKSVARHVKMDREVEGFITGHRPKGGASPDYGDRWVETMANEIEKYPPYRIAALNKQPAPHKRVRRSSAQIAADEAAKAARKAARATRAA